MPASSRQHVDLRYGYAVRDWPVLFDRPFRLAVPTEPTPRTLDDPDRLVKSPANRHFLTGTDVRLSGLATAVVGVENDEQSSFLRVTPVGRFTTSHAWGLGFAECAHEHSVMSG